MADEAEKPGDFLTFLEDQVRAVLGDESATPPDKIKAIETGVKLAELRHKVKNGDDDEDDPGMGWAKNRRRA